MKVYFISPFATDKNLGQAYNQSIALISENDWICLMDQDAMFLTPDAGQIIHEYVKRNNVEALFTCWTNRIHPLAQGQLYNNEVSVNSDIKHHIKIAENQKKELYSLTQIHCNISGFLMLISKRLWNKYKFSENGQCLGIDTEYSKCMRENNIPIYRMEGLYVWHTYRLMNGITDKRHLL